MGPLRAARLAATAIALLACAGCLALRDLRERNAALEQQIKELEKNRDEYVRSYYDLKSQKEKDDAKARQRIDEIQRESARLQRAHEEQVAELERAKQQIAQSYEEKLNARATAQLELQTEISAVRKISQDLREQLEAAQARRDEAEKQLRAKLEELTRTQGELKQSQDRLATLETERNALKTALDQTAAQLAATEKDAAETRKQLQARTSEAASLKADVERLQSEAKQAAAQIEALDRSLTQSRATERGLRPLIEKLNVLLREDRAASSKVREIEDWRAQVEALVSREAMPPDPNLERLYSAAHEELKPDIARGAVVVDRDHRGVVIRVPSEDLFERLTVVRSGNSAVMSLLSRIAALASSYPSLTLMIEGHTDNVRIASASFYDNLELSMFRALNVYRVMMKDVTPAVSPNRIRAIGCGEYYPAADNATAEGRNKNRRVEFVFTPLY